MKKIHLRDPRVPRTAIHFMLNLQDWQLTDDPKRVSGGSCRRMMERQRRVQEAWLAFSLLMLGIEITILFLLCFLTGLELSRLRF